MIKQTAWVIKRDDGLYSKGGAYVREFGGLNQAKLYVNKLNAEKTCNAFENVWKKSFVVKEIEIKVVEDD